MFKSVKEIEESLQAAYGGKVSITEASLRYVGLQVGSCSQRLTSEQNGSEEKNHYLSKK